MKKQYIQPTLQEVKMNIVSPLLDASSMGVGDPVNSGSGLSREVDFDIDGEY